MPGRFDRKVADLLRGHEESSDPLSGTPDRYAGRVRAAVLLIALVGCAADTVVFAYVGEDSWSTPPGVPLQLRVSKLDQPNTITAVALPAVASEAPTGPAQAGTTLPVAIEGVACEVRVLGRTSDTVEKSRPDTEVRRTTPAGTRTIRGLTVRIGCGDQPVPGTDAAIRGGHSRSSTIWAAVFLILGIIAGALADKDKDVAAWLVGIVAVIGGAVFGFVMFEGLFTVTYALLFAGHALAGIIAMRGDTVAFRIAGITGAVIGTALAPLLWPVWTAFGPLCAMIFGAVAGIIGLVAVTLKQG